MKLPKTAIFDESMRDTLESLLKKEYRIINAVDGKEALKELKDKEFQIALIDIRLPDIRGTEILKTIKRDKPDVVCIMMSVVREPDTIVECMKNGAYDYLTKEFDYDILSHRIKNAASLYYNKKQIRYLYKNIQMLESEIAQKDKSMSDKDKKREYEECNFTEREIEMLELKAGGFSNKQIAHRLSISCETVKNHFSNMLCKHKLRTTYQLIAFAYKRGILKSELEPLP